MLRLHASPGSAAWVSTTLGRSRARAAARAFGTAAVRSRTRAYVKFRNGGEHHATEPDVVRALHRIVDPTARSGCGRRRIAGAKASASRTTRSDRRARASNRAASAPDAARACTRGSPRSSTRRPPIAIRDLLELVPGETTGAARRGRTGRAILARFSTGAISHGSISAEAHETLALAMQRDRRRVRTPGRAARTPRGIGPTTNSEIKQVASARFGVTPEYRAFAEELQIKIAQGSKPGEGGQLPGDKVTDEIAPAAPHATRRRARSVPRRITTSTRSRISRSSCSTCSR